MYFPYLYGKQKELIAIRSLSPVLAADARVQPVVEPVRSESGTLRRTLEECETSELTTWVVTNPFRADFGSFRPSDSLKWGMEVLNKVKSRSYARPTLMLSDNLKPTAVREFNAAFAGEEVGLVVLPTTWYAAKVLDELKSVEVARVFFKGPHPSTESVSLMGKHRSVWVEDRFPLRPRNADYEGRHFFTDRHATYASSGWGGFSDYALMAPEPSEGGGPPGAVAFHLSYYDKSSPHKHVHVEHFVSDRTDRDDADTGGKFLEALSKFQRAARRSGTSFGLTAAASDYLSRAFNSDPPTLGTNKQLGVMHHLELMSGLMAGRF